MKTWFDTVTRALTYLHGGHASSHHIVAIPNLIKGSASIYIRIRTIIDMST
jgi:hypothetical protein